MAEESPGERLDSLEKVTADDIQRAVQQAIDNGADSTSLKSWLLRAQQDADGTLDGLAKLWTERNRTRRMMAELRTQLERTKRRRGEG